MDVDPDRVDQIMAQMGTHAVTFEHVKKALETMSFYMMQEGRFFVALTLEEAEAVRSVLHTRTNATTSAAAAGTLGTASKTMVALHAGRVARKRN